MVNTLASFEEMVPCLHEKTAPRRALSAEESRYLLLLLQLDVGFCCLFDIGFRMLEKVPLGVRVGKAVGLASFQVLPVHRAVRFHDYVILGKPIGARVVEFPRPGA